MTPKQNEIQFTVNLENDVLERLTAMAEYGSLSRHKLMVNLLKTGIDEIEVLKHVGIFQLSIIVRNMTESADNAIIRKSAEIKGSEMPVPLRIDKHYVVRLERLAESGDLSRQRLAQNIIKTGLDELESARKIGLTHLVLVIRDMCEKRDLFKNLLEMGKRAFSAGKEVKPK
jgi:predicted transcriptional regulator